jgi:hypothetical protein
MNHIKTILVRLSEKKNEELIDFKKNSIYKYFLSKYMDKLILKKGKKAIKKFEFIVEFMGSIDN